MPAFCEAFTFGRLSIALGIEEGVPEDTPLYVLPEPLSIAFRSFSSLLFFLNAEFVYFIIIQMPPIYLMPQNKQAIQ